MVTYIAAPTFVETSFAAKTVDKQAAEASQRDRLFNSRIAGNGVGRRSVSGSPCH